MRLVIAVFVAFTGCDSKPGVDMPDGFVADDLSMSGNSNNDLAGTMSQCPSLEVFACFEKRGSCDYSRTVVGGGCGQAGYSNKGCFDGTCCPVGHDQCVDVTGYPTPPGGFPSNNACCPSAGVLCPNDGTEQFASTCSGGTTCVPEGCCLDGMDCIDCDDKGVPKTPLGECQCLYQGGEKCNGIDDDCDGQIDNGQTCAGVLQCMNGKCVCPPDHLCGGTSCIDFQTDKNHCGGCDITCGGSGGVQLSCQMGACDCGPGQAYCAGVCIGSGATCSSMLVVTKRHPIALTTDNTNLYWVDLDPSASPAAHLMQLSKSGGSPMAIASANSADPAIAADGTSVFWATDGGRMKVPVGGGTATQLAPSPTPTPELGGVTTSLAVDSNNLYICGADGVSRVAKSGGGVISLASGACNGMAIDATNGYFLSMAPQLDPGHLYKVPLAGGSAPANMTNVHAGSLATMASQLNYGTKIATDGVRVFYADRNGADIEVFSIAVTGTTGTDLSSRAPVATDGVSVYYNLEWLSKAPVAGGSQSTLAEGILPTALAVDSANVYWIVTDPFNGGQIGKTPK